MEIKIIESLLSDDRRLLYFCVNIVCGRFI